jgi:hypothetical protein
VLVAGERRRGGHGNVGDAEGAAGATVREPAGVEAGGEVADAGEESRVEAIVAVWWYVMWWSI